MKKTFLLIFLPVALILLAGCAAPAKTPVEQRWASVQGGQIESAQAGEEFYFTIPVDAAMLAPDPVPIRIQVSGQVASGTLRFELRAPDGRPVWDSGQIGTGDFSITQEVVPEQTGEYHLGLVYSAGVSALYDLSWHALRLSPLVLVPGIGMILVALAFAFYVARRRLSWRYFWLGALFWVITVALKFVFAMFANPVVLQALGASRDSLFSPGNLVAYLYIGALTGVFEAGVTYLVLSRKRYGRATWKQALAFGIGFGVIEALLLGLAAFGSAWVGYFMPQQLNAVTLANLARTDTLAFALAPVLERLAVILAHIFANLLIFYAILRREAKWAWLAVLYKTLLDTPAGFAAYWGTETAAKLWTIEAALVVMALVAVWGIAWLARRYPEGAHPAVAD